MGLSGWFEAWRGQPEDRAGSQSSLARRLYAIGDIHGRLDCLHAMFSLIDQDAGNNARVEIYLGDYIDRGPQSARVIDALIRRAAIRPLIVLRGNHEAMLLQAFETPELLMEWGQHGLATTFASYGIRLRVEDAEACRQSMSDLDAAMPVVHRLWLQSLALMHREAGYAFVHAGIRPGISLERQVPRDLLWIREGFLDSKASFGAVIVHGHSPVYAPQEFANRINVDTGAFATGNLSCLVLDGGPHRFLSTGDMP